MANYRRNLLPRGGCYFFTVNPADRRRALFTDHIDLLRAAFRQVRARHPFAIEAAVILPDHLHAIWILPDGDADFATALAPDQGRLFGCFAARRTDLRQPRRQSRARDLAAAVYWEHTLRDAADSARHLDYIHFNPVKHGHAVRVRDWPFSSFRRWMRLGAYPLDRAGDPGDEIRCAAGSRDPASTPGTMPRPPPRRRR